MTGTVRTSRLRHLRHRRLDGVTRGAEGAKGISRLKRLEAWLFARADTAANGGIGDTAVTDAFTANPAGIAASGVLTFTGLPLNTELVTIDGRAYQFLDTLTDVDNNVQIGSDAAESIVNLVAAIELGDHVFATGVLTLTGQPSDLDTVTLGSVTYTFETSLTDSANFVLIGAAATDSIDNLIAAITAGAGAGSLYGTGTVANTEASAAAGAGDTMDATALVQGTLGNAVVSTESADNTAWGNATLENGADRYARVNQTANTSVTAADGAGDTIDVDALVAGLAGNLIATVEGLTNGSFGDVTLLGGEDGESLNVTGHGLATGDGPILLTTSDTLPAGLALATLYWVRAIDVDNLAFYRTKDDAVFDNARVPMTDTGTGTHDFARAADIPGLIEWLRQDNDPDTIQALTDIDDL